MKDKGFDPRTAELRRIEYEFGGKRHIAAGMVQHEDDANIVIVASVNDVDGNPFSGLLHQSVTIAKTAIVSNQLCVTTIEQ